VGDSEQAFTEADALALRRVVSLVRRGLVDEETAISCARALGQSTDRLVSWQLEAIAELHAGRPDVAEATLAAVEAVAEDLERLLVYTWRRQLAAAVGRIGELDGSGSPGSQSLTVGFADLVSYSRLSQRLEYRKLGLLVQRFEGLAADVVTAGGGRVVKNIGDEVLFVAADPVSAAVIGLSLSERMAVDDLVPDVRVGLAHGPVLLSLGDVYGPTVNLASRLTGIAQPGTVVTDPQTGDLLAGRADLVLVPQRGRQLRGFGQLEPQLITRSAAGTPLISID
jgi:adenylate cyclase